MMKDGSHSNEEVNITGDRTEEKIFKNQNIMNRQCKIPIRTMCNLQQNPL